MSLPEGGPVHPRVVRRLDVVVEEPLLGEVFPAGGEGAHERPLSSVDPKETAIEMKTILNIP